ncbi:ribbon-helix-helix domain-containing protein [Actinomyces sp. B33]|uniref:ribbon-helix-helix protein, CopG family n=1 Tax=Actinomyces sp. B33 TaxID=2942131 RepID=UPI002341A5D6|nr:ribbon-helix-helix protein, CopG family [Actinomyces sp. B33]MDC4232323.1 ribbon-helix-helix domain-containing protein [Actinomyces sp. B33]
MSTDETINGKPVTEEQIQAWADEAESGYDYAALKKRGKGRPGRGAAASHVIALRLTEEEIQALDSRAKEEGTTRSDVIRKALQLVPA